MLHFKPKMYSYCHSETPGEVFVFIEYLRNGQMVVQKIKKLLFGFYLATGRPFPTWNGCLEDVK